MTASPAIAASIKVRRYLSSDIGKILELARRAAVDEHMSFTSERLKFVLDHNLNNLYLCCLVITDFSEVVGVLVAQIRKTSMHDGMIAETELFYVSGGYETKLILAEYKDWAKARGCSELRTNDLYMRGSINAPSFLVSQENL